MNIASLPNTVTAQATIATAQLDASAITTAKIADAAVTTGKLDEKTIQYAEVTIAA